jgi:hypothetical protein
MKAPRAIRDIKMAMSPVRLGTTNRCTGEGQQQSIRQDVSSSNHTSRLVEDMIPLLNMYMSGREQNSWSRIPTGHEIKNYSADEAQQFNRLNHRMAWHMATLLIP